MWSLFRVGRFVRAFIQVLWLTFRREHLDEATSLPRGTKRRGFLRVLFTPEALPLDPVVVKRRRRGVARMLFAPEELPSDPPAPGQRRARWPRWLFGREPLDQL